MNEDTLTFYNHLNRIAGLRFKLLVIGISKKYHKTRVANLTEKVQEYLDSVPEDTKNLTLDKTKVDCTQVVTEAFKVHDAAYLTFQSMMKNILGD